jgi:hypothetical protein
MIKNKKHITLEAENQSLRKKLEEYESKSEGSNEKALANNSLNREHLEEKIKKLCDEGKKHRVGSDGKCWLFGIKNLNFDYGEVWSSPAYWKALINANPIHEDFCLFNFCFQKKEEICQKCSQNIDELNLLYSIFLGNIKKDYNL